VLLPESQPGQKQWGGDGEEERRIETGRFYTHAMLREEDAEDAVDEAEARSGLARANSAERLDDALDTAMAWCGEVEAVAGAVLKSGWWYNSRLDARSQFRRGKGGEGASPRVAAEVLNGRGIK
jgi:hypothetical protein